jgi:hypothetical protein
MGQYPVLEAREPSDALAKAEAELRGALESEWFYEYLDVITQKAGERRLSGWQRRSVRSVRSTLP